MATPPDSGPLTTNRKALQINLEPALYGTLAEIGAGQEVARFFFRAGGASGTVAKSMSAYDMKFSDEIYGKAPRYVSRERLERMLAYEYELLVRRLDEERGSDTCFFAFANTVATKSYGGRGDSHGWMGIRFQTAPREEPNDILLHVRMLDAHAVQQQGALGACGVNMIYAAFFYHRDADRLLESLRDNLEADRLEIDILECRGPAFGDIDPRMLSIRLVEKGFTRAALFGPEGAVLQPDTTLRKRPILVERGGFRPFTHVNADMMDGARQAFLNTFSYEENRLLVLAEITLKNLFRSQGQADSIDVTDLLHRVETLNRLGITVLVSSYFEFYRLSAYFRRYTNEDIAIVLGITNLLDIFNPRYYEHLEGGILEAFGRLFKHKVHLYVYPALRASLLEFIEARFADQPDREDDIFFRQRGSDEDTLITAHNIRVQDNLRNLYKYLLENRFLFPVEACRLEHMKRYPSQVLEILRRGDPDWERHVPEPVAAYIKEYRAFGYPGPPDPPPSDRG